VQAVHQWEPTTHQRALVVAAAAQLAQDQMEQALVETLVQVVMVQPIQLADHRLLMQAVAVVVAKTLAQQVVQAAVVQVGQARQDWVAYQVQPTQAAVAVALEQHQQQAATVVRVSSF
jgi:hypothetical protein